jgi:hypothetical protein
MLPFSRMLLALRWWVSLGIDIISKNLLASQNGLEQCL